MAWATGDLQGLGPKDHTPNISCVGKEDRPFDADQGAVFVSCQRYRVRELQVAKFAKNRLVMQIAWQTPDFECPPNFVKICRLV